MPPNSKPRSPVYTAIYLGLVAFFLFQLSGFYIPGKGFSALLTLGDKFEERYLPQLLATNPYIERDSWGYDAQQYIQIALEPGLADENLPTAVDNLSYRARRILLCWTAWLSGGTTPEGVVWAFSLQNVVFWLGTAWVLLRWFPPTCIQNLIRWAGILFSYGMCWSVRQSLFDGPSLFFLASGMALLEQGRRGWATAVFGLSGLVKETNVLSAVTLVSLDRGVTWKSRVAQVVRAGLVVVPLVVWVGILTLRFGHSQAAGVANFAVPLEGIWRRITTTFSDLASEGWTVFNVASLLWLLSLVTQTLYLVFRPQPGNAWWRLGILYTCLMLVLGWAVWEGEPGASIRVLLPMLLAFNILVPRTRAWLIPLLLGNLTVASSEMMFRSFPSLEGHRIVAAPGTHGKPPVSLTFNEGWGAPERSRFEYWVWATSTESEAVFENKSAVAIPATLSFSINSFEERDTSVYLGDQLLWSGRVQATPQKVEMRVTLPPGRSLLRFVSEKGPDLARPGDVRKVTVNLRTLKVHLETPAAD